MAMNYKRSQRFSNSYDEDEVYGYNITFMNTKT